MKKLNGRTVRMKPHNAKWHLDHPEMYESFRGLDPEYETDTLIHLMCIFGVPVLGTVIREGHDCYLVRFKVERLTTEYHIDRADFSLIQQ
jgi:hypothetical protein